MAVDSLAEYMWTFLFKHNCGHGWASREMPNLGLYVSIRRRGQVGVNTAYNIRSKVCTSCLSDARSPFTKLMIK